MNLHFQDRIKALVGVEKGGRREREGGRFQFAFWLSKLKFFLLLLFFPPQSLVAGEDSTAS